MSLLTRLLFPPTCVACKRLLDWYPKRNWSENLLCTACKSAWESELLDTCGVCSKRVTECECATEEMVRAKCVCFRKLVFYRHGKGDRVQNRLIFHIKKYRDLHTPRFLAKALLPALEEIAADRDRVVLTYVPRSLSARLEYGTDQARALAEALGELSGFSVQSLIKRRIARGHEQKELSARARLSNAEAIYSPVKNVDIKGKCVVLVDDIVTTGATASACVRLLRRAGAKEVFCMAVASDDVNKN